jgi:hypothetical protein
MVMPKLGGEVAMFLLRILHIQRHFLPGNERGLLALDGLDMKTNQNA